MNDGLEVGLGDLAFDAFLVHLVLIVGFAQLAVLLGYHLCLILLLLDQVLVDYVYRVRSHLLLFLFAG